MTKNARRRKRFVWRAVPVYAVTDAQHARGWYGGRSPFVPLPMPSAPSHESGTRSAPCSCASAKVTSHDRPLLAGEGQVGDEGGALGAPFLSRFQLKVLVAYFEIPQQQIHDGDGGGGSL